MVNKNNILDVAIVNYPFSSLIYNYYLFTQRCRLEKLSLS